MNRLLFGYLLAINFAASAHSAQTISGLAEVIDGDTISVRGTDARIRLYGIDAPEGKQTCNDAKGKRYLCGPRAAEALQSIIGPNGLVTCKQMDRDRYKRIVAICEVNGRNINSELVRQGWALDFGRYSDGRYASEEAEARQLKRGLWAGTMVEPWNWRKGQR